MDNTLTIAELKRRGMAAIEDGLEHGPLHILKRNRRAAVVLSEADYRRLLAAGGKVTPGMTAMQWLLAQPARNGTAKRRLDRRLCEERSW